MLKALELGQRAVAQASEFVEKDASINDKNIMKVIFLAGGPGSGKSYVTDYMFGRGKDGMSPHGAVISNSDHFFERGLESHGLPKDIRQDNPEVYDKQMEVRKKAKDLADKKADQWTNSMLPIVIDGTGKDFDKIKKQAEHFKSLGYDVGLNFVNTSLDVAQERNSLRDRKVDPKLVEKMWQDVQDNKDKFREYFGDENFITIQNDKPLSGEAGKEFAQQLYKTGKEWIERPLENEKGKQIVKDLKASGGKYLSDHPEFKDAFHSIKKEKEKEKPAVPSPKKNQSKPEVTKDSGPKDWFHEMGKDKQSEYCSEHPASRYCSAMTLGERVVVKALVKPVRNIVSVVLRANGKVLLGQRKDNNKWTIPGGHVDAGENNLAAAKRELFEETGLKPTQPFEFIGTTRVGDRNVHVFEVSLPKELRAPGGSDPDDEVSQWKWFEVSKIPTNLHNPAMKNTIMRGHEASVKNAIEQLKGWSEDAIMRAESEDGAPDDVISKGWELAIDSGKKLVNQARSAGLSDDKIADYIWQPYISELLAA